MGKQSAAILDNNLSPVQRTAAGTIDRDVLVRAGAGSGKTKTLVARYLHLLDEHRDWHPSDITAVTFTRKAAREMQSRIRKQMMDLVLAEEDTDEKQYWLGLLNEMDSANIGTIHSLCGRILRAHPAEAGLDPAFSVQDDNNAAVMRSRIVEETISGISADPEYETLLNFYTSDRLTDILSGMLKERENTDKAVKVHVPDTVTYLRDKIRTFLTGSEYADYIDEYREVADDAAFQKKNKAFHGRLLTLISCFDEACAALNADKHPADIAAILNSAFAGWGLRDRNDGQNVNAEKIRDDLRSEFPFLENDSKHKERTIPWYKNFWEDCDKADASLRKLWPLIRDRYTSLMDQSGAIDFDAMESLTLDLLRTHPEIRDIWTEKIKALLVDEYQDTNDAQAELFSMLNPSRDRLFAVGDKKQSIYGFRGTNVALFDRRGKEAGQSGGKEIVLDTTYRTEPELLLPMGCLLKGVMSDADLSKKDFYAGYEPMKNPDIPVIKPDPLPKEQPCIDVLVGDIQEKEDDPEGEVTGRMLAQRLSEMMASGLIHTWNDVAILCRKSDSFKQFEKALESWHIPYVTVAGKGYYDRPEIRDVLNILRTAENPHDNAALTGFLFSPLIGFSAEMTALLYRYANKGGLKKSFYQAMTDAGFSFEEEKDQEKLERAREILKELIRISGQVPLDEVLEEACRLTGVRTMLALDSGDRAWLNLDKLLLTARESKMTSVSEFLEYLTNIQETGIREGEAPSDNNGAVRIMTIHQAKGLEFRVTVVLDSDCGVNPQAGYFADGYGAYAFYSSPASPRFEDAKRQAGERDRAEWLRLFYVAATRAEYRLILCGKKPKTDSWMYRLLEILPQECKDPGEYVGPAWDIAGPAIRVRLTQELPETPDLETEIPASDISVTADDRFLDPIPVHEKMPDRNSVNTVALTVGRLVHKGMELWRFPCDSGTDPILNEAFRKILMQADELNPEEQQAAVEKAAELLSRFRDSDVRKEIESAEKRWHELPFSYSGRRLTVNGVIDLLLKDADGYRIIDFKTDELRSMDDLTKAEKKHAGQLEKYRRAVRTTLGEEPVCSICFMDYNGKIKLQPVGRDAVNPNIEADEPEELSSEEPERSDYFFVENNRSEPLFSYDA